MKFKYTISAILLFLLLNLIQTAHAGLAAAVIVQRTIINQCILQAEEGPAEMSDVISAYGKEAAPFLYINGLKIYEVTVKFENDGEIISYPCQEFFPELAPIHFYRGDWNKVIANLNQEIIRLRTMEHHQYGKHLSLR